MNKYVIGCGLVAGAALLVGLLTLLAFGASYNACVGVDEACNASMGNVQSAYQRRFDLLPNLANVVERYAGHEAKTLEAVTAARSMKPTITLSKDVVENPELLAKFQKQQGELSSMLSRLMVVHESYPMLRADAQFLELSREIAGTENRINIARRDYNESVLQLNTNVRGFFSGFVAGVAGVKVRSAFKADEGAGTAPKLMVAR